MRSRLRAAFLMQNAFCILTELGPWSSFSTLFPHLFHIFLWKTPLFGCGKLFYLFLDRFFWRIRIFIFFFIAIYIIRYIIIIIYIIIISIVCTELHTSAYKCIQKHKNQLIFLSFSHLLQAALRLSSEISAYFSLLRMRLSVILL